MFELPWWANWVSFLILVGGAIIGIVYWFYARFPPRLKMAYLRNPFQYPNETMSSDLRIPRGHDITVYHALITNDCRRIEDPVITATYPDDFKVLIDNAYLELPYGHMPRFIRKNEVKISFETEHFVVGHDRILPFPLKLDTRNVGSGRKQVKFDVTFGGIRSSHRSFSLWLEVVDSAFSHDSRFFDYVTFKKS